MSNNKSSESIEIIKIKQNIFAIRELTSREIKRKYVRSHLGLVWSILSPLLHMIVMTLIFSYMFRRNVEYFPLYYLTGSILWGLFSIGTSSALTALVDNKSLLIKTKLHKGSYILARIYTALVNFGFSCIALILILIFFRIKPSLTMLVFFPDVLLVTLFTTGIGYILAILYVYFADIRYLYDVLKTLWFYCCAIFYPVDSLPDFVREIVGFNPMYIGIYIAREGIIYGKWPEASCWVRLGISALTSVVLGSFVFRMNQNKVMQSI